MRVSVIIPVLNSHEIVRRQLLYMQRWHADKAVEIILVDDGSDPPLKTIALPEVRNLRIHETNDKRQWTWAPARNAGARIARGEYLIMYDLDYIIPYAVVDNALYMKEDRMNFMREFGVLTEDGCLTQDINILKEYGLSEDRILGRGFRIAAHTNDFVIKKEIFWKLGGYREDIAERPYPQGEDRWFHREWIRALKRGDVTRTNYRHTVYMFPNGHFCGDKNHNPFGLFHGTSRI